MMKYLSFLQSVPSRPALRKTLTPRKINEIQNTLDMLLSTLLNAKKKIPKLSEKRKFGIQ